MNSFQHMRILANHVSRQSTLEDWQKRPILVTDSLTKDLCSLIPQLAFASEHDYTAVYKSIYINILVGGLWSSCGRPVVTLGHKTAAACATTRVSANDALTFVRPPWPAFFIRLPSPLLAIEDDGRAVDANLLMVCALPSRFVHADTPEPEEIRWWYKLVGDFKAPHNVPESLLTGAFGTGISLWNFNFSLKDILSNDSTNVRWDMQEFTTTDLRTDWLCRYLMVNTCLFIDSPNSQEREDHTARNTKVIKKTSKPDEHGVYNIYDVRAEGIKLNLCDAVKAYVATGKFPKHYATWVQPHWKRVVYGQGRTLRKLQFIETYLRGVDND